MGDELLRHTPEWARCTAYAVDRIWSPNTSRSFCWGVSWQFAPLLVTSSALAHTAENVRLSHQTPGRQSGGLLLNETHGIADRLDGVSRGIRNPAAEPITRSILSSLAAARSSLKFAVSVTLLASTPKRSITAFFTRSAMSLISFPLVAGSQSTRAYFPPQITISRIRSYHG